MAVLFPDPAQAPAHGPLAIGGTLSLATLLTAYSRGIFPWFCEGEPILWWSPDPRMVLFPERFHASRRLRRRMRQGLFTFSENHAFEQVMLGCAEPRRRGDGSWILPEMIRAYTRLFEKGYAQSVEVWREDQLVGGLYGVCLGRVFFAESMFSRCTDASKMAMMYLSRKALREQWVLIDCQFYTQHLASLGACAVSRRAFLHLLQASQADGSSCPASPGGRP